MIDGKTKIVGLIGNPVEHSFSPVMHNAAFKKTGLNYIYTAFKVLDVGNAVKGIKALGIGGVNVTMPHKIAIIGYLDRLDRNAKKIGAVNTVVNKNGKLVGYNTDSIGAVKALEERIKLRGKRIALIGAGGAGRAIAVGLSKKKVEIIIADRSEKKAKSLAAKTKSSFARISELGKLNNDILINATPAGMKPNINSMAVPASVLKRSMLVFDIVYEPVETKLLRAAKKKGCRTINGLEMLVRQGAASFELWTGKKAPVDVMRKAISKRLG